MWTARDTMKAARSMTSSTASHTRLMNMVEGCFALGAIVGPALVATLIGAALSWKWLYLLAAAICILLIASAARVE